MTPFLLDVLDDAKTEFALAEVVEGEVIEVAQPVEERVLD